MEHVTKHYLPAAGHNWALPLYDPLVTLMGAERAKRALLEQAALRPGHRILDVGCGTGTLVVLIKRLHPDVSITGLDPDPKALARAKRKAQRAGVSVQFDQGFSDAMPYPDASFDRVFSSFMFHHLDAGSREKSLREVKRLLAPGGGLHLLDFERPDPLPKGWFLRRIHANPHFQDNSERRILAFMREAGFDCAKKIMSRSMLFGLLHIGYYRASETEPSRGADPHTPVARKPEA